MHRSIRALAASAPSSASTTSTSTSTSTSPRPLRAVVVGGGPGGLSTAIALANARGPRPWKVDLFEKRPLHEVADGTDERRTSVMMFFFPFSRLLSSSFSFFPLLRLSLTSSSPTPPPTCKKKNTRSYGMVVGAERALGPLVACGVDARKVVGSRRLIATAVFPGAAPPPSSSPPPSSRSTSPSPSTSSEGSPAPPLATTTTTPPRTIMNQVSENDEDVDAPTARGALFMVDRAHLVSSLSAHIEEELSSSVSLHWGAPLASLDAEAQVVRFGGGGGGGGGGEGEGEAEAGAAGAGQGHGEERRYDLLVACDGGSSAARLALEEQGLLEVTQLPSPVSLTDYKTFHGLDDAGADELGLDTSGRGSTFAMFVAPPPPPGVKGATYPGSMAVHRRPGGKGWSGLLS